MKKKILIIFAIVLIIMLSIVAMYLIDRDRMENNKKVIFSTWGYDYAPPEGSGINGDNNSTGYNSFIGTIIEESTTYMIVEPNEDEIERKSSDKIRINYDEKYKDYLYGVGRKVLISYSGYIMETYPAQIKASNISVEGYSDFEIYVKKSDIITSKKILNNRDLYKNNSEYDLYYYGLEEVNVKVDDKTISLEEALRSGKVTLSKIISNANKDINNKKITGDTYDDGGTTVYRYNDYTIIKINTLDGNRDMWIGIPEMDIDDTNY